MVRRRGSRRSSGGGASSMLTAAGGTERCRIKTWATCLATFVDTATGEPRVACGFVEADHAPTALQQDHSLGALLFYVRRRATGVKRQPRGLMTVLNRPKTRCFSAPSTSGVCSTFTCDGHLHSRLRSLRPRCRSIRGAIPPGRTARRRLSPVCGRETRTPSSSSGGPADCLLHAK